MKRKKLFTTLTSSCFLLMFLGLFLSFIAGSTLFELSLFCCAKDLTVLHKVIKFDQESEITLVVT